jgi:hypothetical protein
VERQDIDDELSGTGAQELLTSTSMARIAITPYWVRYYDFGAGRLPRFLQDLAERNGS